MGVVVKLNPDDLTVEEMLEKELDALRSGKRVANKAFVIFINSVGDDYDIGYAASQARYTDILAALRIVEKSLIDEMGF